MAKKKEIKRHPMVGWYDPGQLAQTGYEVIVSAMFGKHADKRIIQAISETGSGKPRLFHEITGFDDQEFWFDYVSDVADGFDPTYTVAYHITRPHLRVATRDTKLEGEITKRGNLIVFGGDEVYPTASPDAYNERLKDPYNTAFPTPAPARRAKATEPAPLAFAIPGNHDWYDSLAGFMNLFCRGKHFCGWQTQQTRSYFAVKLPRGWWLFGTDMQLSSSLDDPQMDFFRKIVAEHMGPDDRIILCNAEPYWITDKMYRNDPNYNNRNMGFFEGHVLDHRVAINVGGDRHYYRRHEEISNNGKPITATSKIQKFVAGGGGAFLHPTHREDVDEVGRDHVYELKASFPDQKTSFWLTFWNLIFPVFNLKFGFVTAILYTLTAQAFQADLSKFELSQYPQAIAAVLHDVAYEPIATFWTVLLIAAICFFTDTHSKYFRLFMGPLHALLHFVAVFGLGWAAAYWFADFAPLWSFLASLALVAGGGHIIGSFLMGWYLLAGLNIFGVHHNEAFSAFKSKDYKNFLRFRIDEDGTLTIFPIGIERAVTEWDKGETEMGEPALVPKRYPLEDPHIPILIEKPIVFEKPVSTAPPRPQKELKRPVSTDISLEMVRNHVVDV